jgi:putative SOS response-associated peptidase YedK
LLTNERLAEVHHRMPVALTPEGARLWLSGDPAGNALLDPCAADRLDFYPVSRDAGNWWNDAAYLLEPLVSG